MEYNVNKFTDDKPRIAGIVLKPFVLVFIISMTLFVLVFFAGLWLSFLPIGFLGTSIWYLYKIKDRPFLFDELITYFKMEKGYTSECFFSKEHFKEK